ncbi:hypothetical protein D3C87_1899800 [compost metagenome]
MIAVIGGHALLVHVHIGRIADAGIEHVDNQRFGAWRSDIGHFLGPGRRDGAGKGGAAHENGEPDGHDGFLRAVRLKW